MQYRSWRWILAFSAIGAMLLAGLWATPAAAQTTEQCFPETGQCLSGRFLSYWQQNGGLPVFGYPLTPERVENNMTVQYFERQRFELHPENAAPYDVLLGLLGNELLQRQGVDWWTLPKAPTDEGAQAGCQWFEPTGHRICGPFLDYYTSHGLKLDSNAAISPNESLALFGYPISEPYDTVIEGKTYQAQWFERARFEWHPENPAGNQVLLGRVGAEILGQATPPAAPGVMSPPAPVTVHGLDNGKPITLVKGQTLLVTLPSNPTTGYSWAVTSIDASILQQQGDPQYTAPANAMPGAGGTQTFTFIAAAPGTTTLTLGYRRPFEANTPPVEVFSAAVTVN